MFRACETGVLPEAELEAARAAMSEAEYAQEFECSFDAAIRGAYYGTLIAATDAEKRIGAAAAPRLGQPRRRWVPLPGDGLAGGVGIAAGDRL